MKKIKTICLLVAIYAIISAITILFIRERYIIAYNELESRYCEEINELESNTARLEETIKYFSETEHVLIFDFELDREFHAICKNKEISNFERENAIDELCVQWETISDDLYEKLLAAKFDDTFETNVVGLEDNFKAYLVDFQKDWKSSYNIRVDGKKLCLEQKTAYFTSSAVSGFLSRYRYKMFKAHALELLDMCLNNRLIKISVEDSCVKLFYYPDFNDECREEYMSMPLINGLSDYSFESLY